MVLHLRNTLTRAVEPFVPLDPEGRRVLLYSCGPTVYSYAHIGNFRSFLLADLLRRVLNRRGYEVRHVMNITDVGHMTEDHLADASGEDKLSKAARELGWDPFQVARHFESAFVEDARLLGLRNYAGVEADDPSLHPRATNFIPEMLVMIQALLDKGYAYVDELGQVYFEIAKFPEYGQLSGKHLDELEAGARVELREGKRDPRDFALWKVDKKHLMQWDPHSGAGFQPADAARFRSLQPGGVDARIGRGFPGWHIECSAMARACLSELIDIHTGGEDNIFPHHECEIAQSCAAFGLTMPSPDGSSARRDFARYWLHGRHLLVDHHKMSKRDGTFYTVRNLLDPLGSGRPDLVDPLIAAGFPDGRVTPEVLRFALLSSSFQLPMNFSLDLLAQARANVLRIQSRYERLCELASETLQRAGDDASAQAADAAVQRFEAAFDAALDDNLDVALAMAAVHAFISELNQMELTPTAAQTARAAMERLDSVLAVLDRRVRSGVVSGASLERWLSVDFLQARAAALPEWSLHVERAPLLAALTAGTLPDYALAAAVSEFDADVTVLLLAMRQAAKRQKQFQRADALRQQLQAAKVTVEDVSNGVRWKLP